MAKHNGLYNRHVGRACCSQATLALLAILVVSAGSAPFHPANGGWVSQVVDSQHPKGGGTSLAVQPTGQVHIGYQGAAGLAMKHATNAYGSDPWTIHNVDSVLSEVTGLNSSLAVDAAGSVHACYYDRLAKAVSYATNSSGSWAVVRPVEAGGGQYSAIAVDSAGRVHILTTNSTNNVHYTTGDGAGNWTGATLSDKADPDTCLQIAVDSNKHAHIAYVSGGNLRYANNVAGSWSAAAVDLAVTVSTPVALSLDTDGHAHVAYLEQTSHEFRYATNAPAGTWSTPVVIDTALNSDVIVASITPGATTTIDYFDRLSGHLKRASTASGSWSNVWDVPVPGTANDISIAADKDSNVHLVYTNALDAATTGALTHFTNAPDPHGADLQVTQSRTPGPIVAGHPIDYTVTVTNLGVDAATGVKLTDKLPDHVTFVSATNGTYDPATNTVVWAIGDLPKGGSVAITITVLAPYDAAANPTVTNTATVESTGGVDFWQANDKAAPLTDPVAPVPLHPLVLQVPDNVGGHVTAQDNLPAYPEGATVPLTAVPDTGYRVKGWQGTQNDASTANTNTVVIGTGDQTVVQVTFERIPRTLTAVPVGNGTLTPLSGIYPDGSTVTLIAKPKPHNKVIKWTGANSVDSTDNANSVTMDKDRTVTVEFGPAPNQPPVAMGDTPSTVCPGDKVTLDASASYDPDDDPLTYKWDIGANIKLDDATAAKPTFTAPSLNEELDTAVVLTVSDGSLSASQTYPLKILPAAKIGGRGCGTATTGSVCFYSLCWVGLVCMKWNTIARRRQTRK